jgi:hypothetical protein
VLSAIVLCEEDRGRAYHHTGDPAEALVRSLTSLVRANVEGLLRDVVIAGPQGFGLGLIADHAGCHWVEAETEPLWLRRALELARGPDLLLLRSGHAPGQGFIEEVDDFLSGPNRGSLPRTARLHTEPETFIERLFPRLAPIAGLIAPRDLCLGAPNGRFEILVRHVGKTTSFRACARRVG